MSFIYVVVECGGEWRQKKGFWNWFTSGKIDPKGFRVERSVKFLELVEKIYARMGIDRKEYEIQVTHKPPSVDTPVFIANDEDVVDMMWLYEEQNSMTLKVVLLGNKSKRKLECDDDGEEDDECEEGNYNRDVVMDRGDDCDDRRQYDASSIIRKGNVHDRRLLKWYTTNTANERTTASNPTLVERVHKQGPEEDGDYVTGERGIIVVEGGGGVLEEERIPCVLSGCDESIKPINQQFSAVEVGERCGSAFQGATNYGRHDGSDFRVGKCFKDKDALNLKINSVAVAGKFEVKTKKSSKTLKEVLCANEDCKWRVRALKLQGSDCFVIRQYNGFHTCSLSNEASNHKQATSLLVGHRLKEQLQSNKIELTPKGVMDYMSTEHGVQVSYWKGWRAVQYAQNLIRGTPEQSFCNLPSYFHMLKQVNPNSVTHIEVDSENRFKYCFMALGAAIKGVEKMRKVIGMDRILLTGKFKGVLKVAAAQDSEFHAYPIAWGVVDSENDVSWTWFLEKLIELIPDSPDLCFISDWNQNILKAVRQVYKTAHHGACHWHIEQAIKDYFKGTKVLPLYKMATLAYRIQDFRPIFQDISIQYPNVGSYLEQHVGFEMWSKAHFTCNRYGVMTTHIGEMMNNMLVDARGYPISLLLDFILGMMTKSFDERCQDARAFTGPLTPKRDEMVRERLSQAGSLFPLQLNEFEYHVKGGELDSVVNLQRMSCTCREFDIERLPCVHAISAAGLVQGKDTTSLVYSLCSEYYSSSYFSSAYAETIYPVPPESQWDVPEEIRAMTVDPPNIEHKKGRPRTQEVFCDGETAKKRYKCKLCGDLGHNWKKCPNQRDPPDVIKGSNKMQSDQMEASQHSE